jgi:hypothetical protein
VKENSSERLGDYYSSGKIQSMLKKASWSHYFVLALERERFQAGFCSRGCDMLSVLYIELTCAGQMSKQRHSLCKDYPGRSDAEYDRMWKQLKETREKEPDGCVADLNVQNEKRYWYASRQTTKVCAFLASSVSLVRTFLILNIFWDRRQISALYAWSVMR